MESCELPPSSWQYACGPSLVPGTTICEFESAKSLSYPEVSVVHHSPLALSILYSPSSVKSPELCKGWYRCRTNDSAFTHHYHHHFEQFELLPLPLPLQKSTFSPKLITALIYRHKHSYPVGNLMDTSCSLSKATLIPSLIRPLTS